MAGNRSQEPGETRGQWGTLIVTAAATVTLLGFQAFLTCTGTGARPSGPQRRQAERALGLSARGPAGAGSSGAVAAAPPASPGAGAAATAARAPAGPGAGGGEVATAVGEGAVIPPGGPGSPSGERAEPPAAAPPPAEATAAPAIAPARPPDPAWLAADEAYRLQRAGDLQGAARALDRALALGYRPQAAALERAALAHAVGDDEAERRLLAQAAAGPDEALAREARSALRDAWLAAAWRRRQQGDLAGARQAFEAARDAGADPQRLGVELAYLDLASGERDAARAHLLAAADGGDGAVAAQARAELAVLPRRLKLDLYSELFAWDRAAGADRSGATVPMVRVRALWRPWLDHALDLYVFAQGTREVGPIAVRGGSPVLHADDATFAGGGVLLRGLDGHAGMYAQAGPAVATAPGRAGRTSLDVRAGSFLELSAGRCWPAPAEGLRMTFDPCAEGYGELTYASRFHDDVFGLGRVRGGATLLVAGPVALGLVSEGRLALSRNRDWYDQLADAGAGLRARLLAPFHLDVWATAVAGRYLGIEGRDPAPPRLSYVDLRVQAATFIEF